MPHRRYRTAAFLLALLVPAISVAQEDDRARDEARQHFERGVELMQNEDWDGALVEFQLSLERHRTRSALFNLGNVQKALHRYVEALRTFRVWQDEFSEEASDDERERVEAAIESVRSFVGILGVRVNVQGATVSVDGEAIGTSPNLAPLPVGVGHHTVRAELAGHAPVEQEVAVGAGQTVPVLLELAAAGESGEPETPVAGPEVPAGPVEDDGGVDQLWFWTTAGTAVALAIGAGVTGGLTYSTHEDFIGGATYDPDLADKGETLELTTNVLAGLAGAAAVAALVLVFFTDFGGEAESPPEGVAVTVAPGGVALIW